MLCFRKIAKQKTMSKLDIDCVVRLLKKIHAFIEIHKVKSNEVNIADVVLAQNLGYLAFLTYCAT